MEKFAVIQTGGKQYRVREGDILKVERLEAKEGEKVTFDKVLLRSDGKKVEIGEPYLENKVEAEVMSIGRGKGGVVFHYKPKKRYRKKRSYRPSYTEVKITGIR